MPASVHHPGRARSIGGGLIGFINRQSIHVGPNGDARPLSDVTVNAGFTNAALYGKAQPLQFFGGERCCSMLMKT
jgi:hypothetical protein